ncbi:hypothetical protein GQ600_20454 [Phytophthora cactorum]|nr:hypothetical protein GQ600_20454 [Phytophthora cactorum]
MTLELLQAIPNAGGHVENHAIQKNTINKPTHKALWAHSSTEAAHHALTRNWFAVNQHVVCDGNKLSSLVLLVDIRIDR